MIDSPRKIQAICMRIAGTKDSAHSVICIMSSPSDSAGSKTSTIAGNAAPLILAPISLGELLDKLTILQIKQRHIKGSALANVQHELQVLQKTLDGLGIAVDVNLIERLGNVNRELWQIEDEIRIMERRKDFGGRFVDLARSVYQTNDRRAAIKKEINSRYGSALVEEKSYQNY